MIILDTHIWIWYTSEDPRLNEPEAIFIRDSVSDKIGVSAFSLWEIGKLHEKGRLELSVPLDDWFSKALFRPGITLLPLSPQIVVDSIQLPGTFHKDPGDQVIVATARIHDCVLVTYDKKILNYEHVKLFHK